MKCSLFDRGQILHFDPGEKAEKRLYFSVKTSLVNETQDRFKVGLSAIRWKKIAYDDSRLPLLGTLQSPGNKPRSHPKK